MMEIYEDKYWEIHDPQDARQVALFTDEADAKAYAEWRNRDGEKAMTEAEWLSNDEEDDGFVGAGLVVGENGELAIVHADGVMDDWRAFRVNDTEAQSLALMISAVLE